MLQNVGYRQGGTELKIEDLNIAIYADGADIDEMIESGKRGWIKGFTTNPSLMRKAGVTNYTEFAKRAVLEIPDKPISFEVFSDEFKTMKKEALVLSSYGKNVFVKIPVTNTRGESSVPLISELSKEGVRLNVTAVFTVRQAEEAARAMEEGIESIISVFAGRIADTGCDPEGIMKETAAICRQCGAKSLWASCREVFNIMQAERCGVDIITVTEDVLGRLGNLGKGLEEFSLETVRMFERDGRELGFSIE